MTHFYIKRRLVEGPVKTLCDGRWVARPTGHLRLYDVTCPECLKILIKMEEKRLKILNESLTKALTADGMH